MLPAVVAGLILAAGAAALRRDITRDITTDHTQGSFTDALRDVLARGNETCDLCAGPHWLFVVGTGWSGSTRVMNMVNGLPGFYLAGENWGLFEKLSQALADIEKYGFAPKNHGPFGHRQMSREAVYCGMQELTRAFIGADSAPPGTHTIGFKEIRWSVDVLNMTSQVFPCAKYIVNTRKQNKTMHKLRQKWGLEFDSLPNRTAALEAWQLDNANRSFLIRRHRFGEARFNNLLKWLNVSGCSFTTVEKHPDPEKNSTYADVLRLDGQCTVPGEQPAPAEQPATTMQSVTTEPPVAARHVVSAVNDEMEEDSE